MDNKHVKFFVNEQSKGCKSMPKMHQNTFGGRNGNLRLRGGTEWEVRGLLIRGVRERGLLLRGTDWREGRREVMEREGKGISHKVKVSKINTAWYNRRLAH